MQQTTLMKLIADLNAMKEKVSEDLNGRDRIVANAAIEACIMYAIVGLPSERKDIEEAYVDGFNNGGQYVKGEKWLTKEDYFTTTFITDKTDKE